MDFLRWRALSEFLTGSPINLRKGKVPKEHKKAIDELLLLLEYWRHKYDKQTNQTKKK